MTTVNNHKVSLSSRRYRPQNNRMKAKQHLKVVLLFVAFVGVTILICIWLLFRFLLGIEWPLLLLIPLTLIEIVLLILLIRIGYTAEWTGLKDKTLWDWLILIGTLTIPIVVAGATLLFSIQQAQNALDQQQATILQTYIANIQDLILKYNLLGESTKPNNSSDAAMIGEARELARARTLTAIQGLDPERKSILLQFLYETKLIGFTYEGGAVTAVRAANPIINLDGADLSGADLSGVFLEAATLSGVDLDGAGLNGDILNCTHTLGNPVFKIASIRGVDLSGANFNHADLRRADLSYANLSGANLNSSNLTVANLSCANLSGVQNLSIANLSYADLSGANLRITDLTQQQLDQVYSCKGAILPQGLTCHRTPSQ